MKKLLSVLLITSMILTLSNFTLNVFADEQIYFEQNFDGGASTGLTLHKNNSTYGVESDPDTTRGGKALKAIITSDGGSANIDVTLSNVNSGTVAFESDFYLASSYNADAWVTVMPKNSAGYVSSAYVRVGDGTFTGTTGVLVSSIPRDKWLKLRYIIEYTNTSGTANIEAYIIGESEILRVLNVNNVALGNGLTTIRFQADKKSANACFWLDNIKYYQPEAIVDDGFSISQENHFMESFADGAVYALSSTAVSKDGGAVSAIDSNYNLRLTHNTNSTEGSTGTATTVADPAGGAGKALAVVAVDDLGTRNRIETYPAFDKYTAGVQVAEVDLYLPQSQFSTGEQNRVFVAAAANGTFSGLQFYLNGSSATTPQGTYTTSYPRDEWFTARMIMDYSYGTMTMEIEEDDGTITNVHSGTLPAVLKQNGCSNIFVDGGGTRRTFYIGAIRYYQKPCEEYVEDFEDGTGSGVTITKSNVRYSKSGSLNSGVPNGKSWFFCVSGSDGYDNTIASSWDLSTKDITVRGGITVASVDFWMNGARNEGEEILVYAQTYDSLTGNKVNYGSPIRIQNNKVWYGESTEIPADAVTITYSKWYTLRITYNHETHYYRYEMIKDDGTVYLLGSGFKSESEIANLGNSGVCALAIDYDRVADSKYNGYYWYIDNIKINNIVLDDLVYNDTTYTATVSYQANADTAISSKLVLAQYNTTGELISIQTATPVYTESATEATATFTKADGATKTKLMFLDDLNTVIPFATSIEK